MDILEEVGLSKNEIKVYFALLELDISTTTPLVKKSGIPNSKIYPTLDKLLAKGLVSSVLKDNVRHFQASSPSNLIEMLKRRESLISEQKRKLRELIPQIVLKKKLSKEKQVATVYEGMKGIAAVYHDILDVMHKGEEYYVFNLSTLDNYEKVVPFYKNYHLKRDRRGIIVNIITDTRLKGIAKEVFRGMRHCRLKFMDEPLPSSTLIYANKVVTILFGDKPTAFMIESRQNYEQYRQFFVNMWNRAVD